jgi:hypothetical protein
MESVAIDGLRLEHSFGVSAAAASVGTISTKDLHWRQNPLKARGVLISIRSSTSKVSSVLLFIRPIDGPSKDCSPADVSLKCGKSTYQT